MADEEDVINFPSDLTSRTPEDLSPVHSISSSPPAVTLVDTDEGEQPYGNVAAFSHFTYTSPSFSAFLPPSPDLPAPIRLQPSFESMPPIEGDSGEGLFPFDDI